MVESLKTALREARNRWLTSKENSLGRYKDIAANALLKAVSEGHMSVNFTYTSDIASCLPELKAWAKENECKIEIGNHYNDSFVQLTWLG